MRHELVVRDTHDNPPLDVVVDAVGGSAHGYRDESRTWYDTFDWRLYRKGLILEHHVRASHAWLTLSDLTGHQVARMPTPPTGPISVHDIAEGAIRDRIATLAGIRALLPRASVKGPVASVSVLDETQKTVARVAVEGPLSVHDDGKLPQRVRVEVLRGYEKQARKVSRRLAGVPGLQASDETLFTAACRASGLEPGMYLAKPQLRFGAQASAGEAFADLFAHLLEVVQANVDGTLQQLDTEFLHDLRVAVRRSRSALKAGKGVIDENTRRSWAAELKWVGDLTTPSRDLDVHLLDYEEIVAGVPEPDSLEPFRKLLARNCRKAHTALNRGLRSKRFAALMNGWAGELAGAEAMTGPQASDPVAGFAQERLNTAWRRVRKRGTAITDDSAAEALHDLRKRCKELRYLLEFFGGLYGKRAHREVVNELKLLQDNLGEFQDAEEQRFLVLQSADELASSDARARTLLALGRLEESVEQRQQMARQEFAQRWAHFDRNHNRRLFASMIGAR